MASTITITTTAVRDIALADVEITEMEKHTHMTGHSLKAAVNVGQIGQIVEICENGWKPIAKGQEAAGFNRWHLMVGSRDSSSETRDRIANREWPIARAVDQRRII